MQDASIHWNGEAVAVVLAETQEQADHAASLIEVAYDAEPAVTSFAVAKARSHPPESILGEPPRAQDRRCRGGARPARRWLSTAPIARRATTTTRSNCTPRRSLWEGDQLTIHDASQLVNATASTIAGVFGLKDEQVRVISPYVGGGFGGKCLVGPPDPGRPPRRSWREGRCASCCRARVCSGWSAAAPRPSSGWRSARRLTARSPR